MKESEKWWKKYAAKKFKNECGYERKYAMIGYKAALEWVAKRGMHHYGNDFLTDMNELSTEIQIELGMLDEKGKVVL